MDVLCILKQFVIVLEIMEMMRSHLYTMCEAWEESIFVNCLNIVLSLVTKQVLNDSHEIHIHM